MTSILTRLRSTRTKPAEDFAVLHFGGCASHSQEASAVFLAVERMCGSELQALDPDAALRDVLPPRLSARDSLDELEHELALEEELTSRRLVRLALRRHADEAVLKALLGPLADGSSWDPMTIWTRSARGVINERVRLHGGECSCAEAKWGGTGSR